MANENRINQPWKKLLEDEMALPGEGLPDKAVAWKKLHRRLHLQPRRNRVIWYWVAAACLLLALTVPLTFLQNSGNAFVKHDILKKTILPLPEQSMSLNKTTNTAAIAKRDVVAPSKKETIKIKTNDNNQHAAVSNESGWVINSREENTEIDSSTLPVIDSTTIPAIATVQPKQQLKVVHVNELGDPVTESSTLARNMEPHSFELQIGKEEVVTNTAVNRNKSRFAALTIKTSPTN